jgi:hypothetical protein
MASRVRPQVSQVPRHERPLAVLGGGRHRGEGGAAESVAQIDSRAGDQLSHRVAVHVHDLGDLVVRELLELAQRQHLALALGQLGVGAADLLLARLEQEVALRVVPRVPGLAALGLRGLLGRLGPPALLDQVVTGVACRGEEVGAEGKLAALQLRQAPQHVDKRVLGGVGRLVLRAKDPQAEVVGALLVAAVQLRKGVPVTPDRALSQARLVGAGVLHGGHVVHRTAPSRYGEWHREIEHRGAHIRPTALGCGTYGGYRDP